MEQFKTTGNTFICPECKNENTIPDGTEIGDVIECEFCGIEFRVLEKDSDGNYTLEILEEEK